MVISSDTGCNVSCSDNRETLCNARITGHAQIIQYKLEEIVELRGVMVDVDPQYLSTTLPWGHALGDPRSLWIEHIQKGLAAIGLVEFIEARMSGTGLHLVIWFDMPVPLASQRDREIWDARIRLLQSLLLGDPQSPGITALTRPVGSRNSKSQVEVETIHAGRPITAEQFAIIVDQLAAEPARTVIRYVYGSDRVTPCPYCGVVDTTCSALYRNTTSYNCCGKRDLLNLFQRMHAADAACGDLSNAQLKRFMDASRVVRDRQYGVGLEPHYLTGILASGQYVRDRDGAIGEVVSVLADSGRVYRYGDDVVVDETSNGDFCLRTICIGDRVAPGASICVSRWVMCRIGGGETKRQYEVPTSVLAAALTIPEYRNQLPEICHYSKRPIFAADFSFLSGGYHPEHRILIHSNWQDGIEADEAPEGALLSEIAPCLHRVLSTFCFATVDDMHMTVAILITGILSNHFIGDPKPLIVLEGNRPGIGKTLLAQVIGVILDGSVPSTIPYSGSEEEVAKTIAAHVDGNHQSVLILDNCRNGNNKPIQSPMLESMCVSAYVTLRRLGHTELIRRPNHYQWLLTMNDPRLNADLASRSVLVRLSHDGDPGQRSFEISRILAFVEEHRNEILGELIRLIRIWIARQCPRSHHRHRCAEWAQVVGGVMSAIGAGTLFQNHDSRIGEVDQQRQQIQELAQRVFQQTGPLNGWYLDVTDTTCAATVGHLPSEWALYLSMTSDVAGETHYTASAAGTKLAAMVGITCDVEIGGTDYRVTLRRRDQRSRQKLYYFERAVVAAHPPAEVESTSGGEGGEQ